MVYKEPIIEIGYRDALKLIGAINAIAFKIESPAQKRAIVSVHFSIQKALRDGKFSFILDLGMALTISKALELFYEKSISDIIRDAISSAGNKV